jgi:transposase
LSTYSECYEAVKWKLVEYKAEAHYWKRQFDELKVRETKQGDYWKCQIDHLKLKGKEEKEELKTEIEELKAQLRKREHQLFGRKTERHHKSSERLEGKVSQRPRGQQVGKPGHKRRDYSHLPEIEEEIDFVEKDKCCSSCGLAYEELSSSEDSEVLEIINVKAHRRVIKRKKYRRMCCCEDQIKSKIVTAPARKKLLPKSKLGITVWTYLLLQKYEYQQPVYRALKQLKANGLSLALGTVTEGFRKIQPFLEPAYNAIVKHSLTGKHWHADETGWKVFEPIEKKTNHKWYLWIFSNQETVIYKLDPRRSSKVLEEHFGKETRGILNVDRYVAYKVIAKTGLFTLAFCWAHVRRDFLNHSKAHPKQENWGLAWVNRIGKFYEINNKRIRYQPGTKQFQKYHQQLQKKVDKFRSEIDKELADDELLPSRKKLVKSLDNHWPGLTVFVERPEIPMDNNQAERGLRSSVIGRKNYYGSSAIWSGKLAAALFTIFETMKRWNINPHIWLITYLQFCAAGKCVPEKVEKFMPWNMTEEQRLLFSKPPIGEDTS